MADQGREARLKAALRQNLKRRKQQARKRAASDLQAGSGKAGGAAEQPDAQAATGKEPDKKPGEAGEPS
ncbi:hypothetical protein [Saliniramus sp.]|uniref:hypothetical protein n=1 Tax=Saliniramus sp. TaxID=2986772 RepID=UPI002B907286|nr:hypothetical protein [Saliniramus sp.]HMB09570.1 hypothetical protein [Saliniramus sp.]